MLPPAFISVVLKQLMTIHKRTLCRAGGIGEHIPEHKLSKS